MPIRFRTLSEVQREGTLYGVPISPIASGPGTTEQKRELLRDQLRGGSGDPGAITITDPLPKDTVQRILVPEAFPGQDTPLPIQPIGGGPTVPYSPYSQTGITGVDLSPGGINVGGNIGGIPINVSVPFGSGGGGEAPAGPAVPELAGSFAPTTTSQEQCPGLMSVRDPITGNCINLDALPPGGAPAVTGPVQQAPSANGYGPAVVGLYGVGRIPRVEIQSVSRCPPGFALGKDGVCYEGLHRNSPRRKWKMGMKPLMTGGDRAAIRKAAAVAGKLDRSKKSLKKASRMLAKVC